jgi:hypothetical protein
MRFLKLPIFAAAASLALWACGEEDRVTPSEMRDRVFAGTSTCGRAVCRYDAYEGSGIVSGSRGLAGTFTLPDTAPEREHLELGPGDEHRFPGSSWGQGDGAVAGPKT